MLTKEDLGLPTHRKECGSAAAALALAADYLEGGYLVWTYEKNDDPDDFAWMVDAWAL
jgi:hypothetical protein